MSQKRILIATLVLAVTAGALYSYEQFVAKQQVETERAARLLVGFNAHDIATVSIQRPDEALTMKKKDGQWRITEPVETPADEETVMEVIASAVELTSERTLGPAGDPKEYGLDEPITVIFDNAAGERAGTLIIGGLNPDDKRRYVMANGKPGVYMVKRWTVDDILVNLFTARDKRMFHRPAGSVTGFTYESGSLSVSVEKGKGGQWRITGPLQAETDEAEVNRLVGKFVPLSASGFIEESADDVSPYGLDTPLLAFTAVFGGDGETETLLIGGLTGDNNRYAMMRGSKTVVRVPGDIMSGLPPSVTALRERSLVAMEPEETDEIVINYGGERVRLVPAPPGAVEEDTITGEKFWRIVEPVETKADQVAVSNLLHDLTNAKAVAFVHEGSFDPAKYGLDTPALTLAVTSAKAAATLTFSEKGSNGSRRFVAVDGRDAVMEVDEKTFGKLAKNLAALRERRLFDVRSDEVGRIVVKRLGQVFDVRKSGDEYRMVSPEEANLTPTVWNRFLWRVIGLRFDDTLDTTMDQAAAAFDDPALEISIYDTSDELVETVVAAGLMDGKTTRLAKTVKQQGLFTISERFVSGEMVRALEALMGVENRISLDTIHGR